MNKLIGALKSLDITALEGLLQKEPKWLTWAEENGKNALHYYLGGIAISNDPQKAEASLQILRLLLKMAWT
jgi:hypothetical protein